MEVGLFDNTSTEISGNGYARQSIDFSANGSWDTHVHTQVTFPNTTAQWDNVNYVKIFNSGGSEVKAFTVNSPTPPVDIPHNDYVVIPQFGLDIQGTTTYTYLTKSQSTSNQNTFDNISTGTLDLALWTSGGEVSEVYYERVSVTFTDGSISLTTSNSSAFEWFESRSGYTVTEIRAYDTGVLKYTWIVSKTVSAGNTLKINSGNLTLNYVEP